ncbi:MAG: hypothetical protein ABSE97_05095 [Verrucomicrobiota bacterium]|jgi:hypothetical protein
MKIFPSKITRTAMRHGERGFMTIALLVILSLLLIYATANIQTLNTLKQEIKIVEKKQIQRLERDGAQPILIPPTKQNPARTNSVTATFTCWESQV